MVDRDETRRSSSDQEGEDSDGSTAQQLQTLKSLIPNATSKTDKRSILEEAHDYLLRIHEETEQIEKEHRLSQPSSSSSSSAAASTLQTSTSTGHHDPKILMVEVEELMERRFVVKICWRNEPGVAAHVQRVIECLDVKMTSIVVKENNTHEMLTTAFIKVKKDIKMTEEEIYNLIRNAAARFGLL